MKKNLLCVLLLTLWCAAATFAQTTTFTYQGRLTDGGNSPNGTYDLQFTLFDQSNAPIGAAQTVEDATVTNGVFTVALDFGATAFANGAARSLQIGVRPGTSTGAFTVLAPRQAITATPYAIQAQTAANATQLGGAAANTYLQTTGSGANLTDLSANNVSSGTLSDARLSPNVAFRNSANTFAGDQTINGDFAQTGGVADLNTTNGLVARGAFGAGNNPATGAGVRMVFYPGKAAFRAGRVFDDSGNGGGVNGSTFWDDAGVGASSAAFGTNNRASGANSFAAGTNSTASGANSFAFGDGNNFSAATASGDRSFAFNGTASAPGAIAFGSSAQATGDDSLAFGPSSIASGLYSVVIGPSRATGSFAVAIGLQNLASGNFSLALGKNADTDNRQGAIVISDGCAGFSRDKVVPTANNQVNIRGCGGFRFFTSQTTPENGAGGPISGVSLAAGGSQWLSLSDRNSKENFRAVNARDVLRKVLKMPITTWNYKSQDASIRHIGAMAQDFKAAFEVGEDDKHISALDPDGVAFAAIQGVHQELTEKTAKLQAENSALKTELAAQNERLARLEQKFVQILKTKTRPARTNRQRSK